MTNKKFLELLRRFVCFEATRWIGVTERGENQGEMVNAFQRAVNPESRGGEAWCADFVDYCVEKAMDSGMLVDDVVPRDPRDGLIDKTFVPSESVLKMVESYEREGHEILFKPQMGHIVCWHRGKEGSGLGHCGIVNGIISGDDHLFTSIEGNSEDKKGRQGVFTHTNTALSKRLIGFLEPFDLFKGYKILKKVSDNE